MVQNRNKLLDLFVGNLSNAALHRILEQSAEDEELRQYYGKEVLNSMGIAKNYREKINPVGAAFPEDDGENVRRKVIERVKNKLKIRILEGYENVKLDAVDKVVDELLLETKVISRSSQP